jgi:hypothetical protein
MSTNVDHYLISITFVGNVHVHCYAMTVDGRYLTKFSNLMMNEAERLGMECVLPIILVTKLDTGIDIVREIIAKTHPEAQNLWETATNLHYTIFVTHGENPDNTRLMELH